MHVNAFPSPILNQRTPSHHALTEDAKMDLESISHVQGSSLQMPENSPIPPITLQSPAPPPPDPPVNELLFAGFNGRCNKVCDTCYSFWVGGNLAVSIRFPSTSIHIHFFSNQISLRRFSKRSISSTSPPTANISYLDHSTSLAALANSPATFPVGSPFLSIFYNLNPPILKTRRAYSQQFHESHQRPLDDIFNANLHSLTDILHSYLGLAALAAMREAELRSIDPMLCMSVSAREGLESTAVAAATANGKAHEEGIE